MKLGGKKRKKIGIRRGSCVKVRMEDDRISSLPDEIIHHIMSFYDTKYAVQTSVLSSRWKLLWTTLPYLNFSSQEFRVLHNFSKFVNQVLSLRNDESAVSSIDLIFKGIVNQRFMHHIGRYVASHNVQKVNIFSLQPKRKEDQLFPLCFFNSQSLKHLIVSTYPLCFYALPRSPWEFPAVTTVELNNIWLCSRKTRHTILCLDLFSKCVNLMNLTLSCCRSNGTMPMKIQCPRLVNLSISNCWTSEYEISAPNLSSFYYQGSSPTILSTEGLNSLDKVNLRMNMTTLNKEKMQRRGLELMNMLHELCNARFVTLNGHVIEFLSKVLDSIERTPSPFCNLKCLSLVEVETQQNPTKSSQVINYLLNSSPTATVSMENRKVSDC